MEWERGMVSSPATPVLVGSGFVESNDPRWRAGLVPDGNLMAPLAAYPAAGRVVPYPGRLDGPNAAFADRVARDVLASAPEFLVVTSDPEGFHLGFDRHLIPLGFESVNGRRFEGVEVLAYRKKPGWITPRRSTG
jgi:hypothetical protein